MSKGQYERQLRRKISDAESQYSDLGMTRIEEQARRVLPIVQSELKVQRGLLDDMKRRVEDGETINLDVYKERVKALKDRVTDLRVILTPPARNVHKTAIFYATVTTRILDFDGSDHKARQFGGTIVTLKDRVEVPDSAMADRDPQDNPRREWLRSDVTDETRLLQSRLEWLRARVRDVNTAGSTAQWLLTLPFRETDKATRRAVRH